MKRFAPLAFRRPHLPVIDASGLRIAQITAGASFERASLFPVERWRDLETFNPNALVGAAADLQRLLERLSLSTLKLASVDCAVFVLTAVGDRPAPDALRSFVWHSFGVPCYELYVASTGDLLAWECEAQDGWHVEPGARFRVEQGELYLEGGARDSGRWRTGLVRTLDDTPCGCGRRGLRIMMPASRTDTPSSHVFEPLLISAA